MDLINYDFDTSSHIKKMVSLGMPEEQAQVCVEIIKEIVVFYTGNSVRQTPKIENLTAKLEGIIVKIEHLATKEELQALRTEIQEIESKLKAEIQEVRNDLQVSNKDLKSEIQLEIQKVRTDLQKTENTLIRWLIGIAVALGGLMTALLMYFK